jgi:hypothetical protein
LVKKYLKNGFTLNKFSIFTCICHECIEESLTLSYLFNVSVLTVTCSAIKLFKNIFIQEMLELLSIKN